MFPARRPAAGLRLKLVLAFYVLAVSLLPLAHQHIVCHFKSATHCPACSVGSADESGWEPAMFGRFTLTVAGDVVCEPSRRIRLLAPSRRTGRAPPAVA